MSEVNITQRIQLRRDTAADWADLDPVLAPGEPGVETDTGITRIGDGVTPFTQLPDNIGPQGETGDVGPQGEQGPQGDVGLQGPQGGTGDTGVIFQDSAPLDTDKIWVDTDEPAGGTGTLPVVTDSDPATGRMAINGVEMGDTGWRRILTADAIATLYGRAPGSITGNGLDIRRQGNIVTVRFDATNASGVALSPISWPTIVSAGFRPSTTFVLNMRRGNGLGEYATLVLANSGFVFGVYQGATSISWSHSYPLSGTGTYGIFDAWPTSLPGTAL